MSRVGAVPPAPSQSAPETVVAQSVADASMGTANASLATQESAAKSRPLALTTAMTKGAVWMAAAPASQDMWAPPAPTQFVPRTAMDTANASQDGACATRVTVVQIVRPELALATATGVENVVMDAACASQASSGRPVAPRLAPMIVTREATVCREGCVPATQTTPAPTAVNWHVRSTAVATENVRMERACATVAIRAMTVQ